MWKIYALLSALFAALTAICAKVGVKDVDSNLATAIRTTVILFLTWGIVFASGHLQEVKSVSRYTWVFLVLSGISTGLSWLFYFKAIQIGDVSRVAPVDKLSVVLTIILAFILLKEPVSAKGYSRRHTYMRRQHIDDVEITGFIFHTESVLNFVGLKNIQA